MAVVVVAGLVDVAVVALAGVAEAEIVDVESVAVVAAVVESVAVTAAADAAGTVCVAAVWRCLAAGRVRWVQAPGWASDQGPAGSRGRREVRH